MLAIYKKELRSYLCSVTGWLFMALLIFFPGLYFASYSGMYGYPDLSYALSNGTLIFVIGIPILTMRVFAEERHTKTDQLILTAPVKTSGIVLAKFFAMETLFLITIAVLLTMPIILSRFGQVLFAQSYVAILAFFLFGSMCIAIGEFISAITENVVVAAVLSIAVLFTGFVMTGICSLISENGNIITRVLDIYNPSARFSETVNGTLELSSLVYFITAIFFFLYLTTFVIEKRRYSFKENRSFGIMSVVTLSACLLMVVSENVLVKALPANVVSFDLTPSRLYSLTDEGKKVAESVDENVTIYVLTKDQDSLDLTLVNNLKNFETENSRISVQYVNPVYSPRFYESYSDSAPSDGSVIVASGTKSRVIDYEDLFETQFNFSTYNYDKTGYDGEGLIASALSYVTTDSESTIYLITGHGEASLEEDYTAAVTKLNATMEETTIKSGTIPEDADILIINVPESDLLDVEAKALIEYINGGGKILINIGFLSAEMPNLQSVLGAVGLKGEQGMVIEQDANHCYNYVNFLLPDVAEDDVTTGAIALGGTFAPYCGAISIADEDDYSFYTLLSSSEKSFLKKDLSNDDINKTAEDSDGPCIIGIRVAKENDGTIAVVYASNGLFTSSADMVISGTNSKLFADSLKALTGSTAVTFSIPVKSFAISNLTLSSAAVYTLFAIFAVVIPCVLLLTGILIYIIRRKRG